MPFRDPEAHKAWRKVYYQSIREKHLAAVYEWQSKNRGKVLASKLKYRLGHREKIRQDYYAWQAANPDKIAASRKRYKDLFASYPPELKAAIRALQKLKKVLREKHEQKEQA